MIGTSFVIVVCCIVIICDLTTANQQIFLQGEKRVQSSGDVIGTVTVSTSTQCAAVCLATSGCGGFNVSRRERVPAGHLQCQLMTGKGQEVVVSSNDRYDYYQGQTAFLQAPEVKHTTAQTSAAEVTIATGTTSTSPEPTTAADRQLPPTPECRDAEGVFNWTTLLSSCPKQCIRIPKGPSSEKQFASFRSRFQKKYNNGPCAYWIGLVSEQVGANATFAWRWIDGTELDPSSGRWDTGQPTSGWQTSSYVAFARCDTGKWIATADASICCDYIIDGNNRAQKCSTICI